MTENIKTLVFVLVGAIALSTAWIVDRPTAAIVPEEFVGKTINNDFEVDEPKRLEIIKFDRQTADTRKFEVSSVDGVWSIPSKEGYPADATRQMASAASALVDRKILMVASQGADTHEQFGVVDPLSAKLDASSAGVGTRVIMTDADDKRLVDMIIGKQVKGSENRRYVRNANQNAVYVVELDPEPLSTDFNDWIEEDLLKLSPFDIRKVFINDYSADLALTISPDGRLQRQVNWDRRGEVTLTYDNNEAKWNLAELKKFAPSSEQMVDDKLADDEEVNQDKLGELRNGLDDLLIVDVVRKPEGLSSDLKAGEGFLNNRDAIQDLIDKGFAPVPLKPNAEPEILSSEGEVVCTLRDGVEYVLRFGKLQIQTESAADGEEPAAAPADPAAGTAAADPKAEQIADAAAAGAAKDAEKKPEASADEKNLRRYLFVMARYNEDIVEKPKLKEVPPLPTEATPPAEQPPAASDATTDSDVVPASAEQPADGAAPAAASDTEQPTGEGEAPAEPPSAEASTPTDESTPAEDAAAPAAEGDKAADEAKKTAELEKLVEERKAIEEENQRLQDEYDETIKKGRERVTELNKRFGDWYYVISNDVFKQIHLDREQAIKKKDKPAEAPAAGAPAPGSESPASGLPNLPFSATPANEKLETAPATQTTPAAAEPAEGESAIQDAPSAN